jgi:hypothetical protein
MPRKVIKIIIDNMDRWVWEGQVWRLTQRRDKGQMEIKTREEMVKGTSDIRQIASSLCS